MLNARDLVLCAGTLLQADFREKVEAAVTGGFQGITLWPQDVERAHADGLSDADMRGLLADNGLELADLDPLLSWVPGWKAPERLAPGVALADERDFYAIAEAIGGRSINIAQGFGSEMDIDDAAEAVAGLCDRAADHGLLITLEFLPWSGIPDVATAWEIVRRADRANATLMFDTWHYFRGSSTREQIDAVPGAKIGSVQINDAPSATTDDAMQESMTARLLPGEGDIPVADLVRALDAIGADAPIGVEVFSRELDKLPPTEVGRRCGNTARAILAEART